MGGILRSNRPWLLVAVTTLLSWTVAKKVEEPESYAQPPRHFELALTWEQYAPDGRAREMILVNGQFPGPTLEIFQGDEVEVVVHNKMPFNTTVHFHGIEQHLTPWSDGTPGLSQRQIQPERSFKYRWTATQYGAYWYHAHQKGQLDDGLYGPIIIHPYEYIVSPFSLISSDPKTLQDIEKAAKNPTTLVLSDFRHMPSYQIDALERASNVEFTCYDSILFNGKGSVDCWPPEKIASLLTAQQKGFLKAANLTSFTPKGCLPGGAIASVLSPGVPVDLSVVPPEIFNVCIPSTGPKEVITVTKKSHESQKWLALDLIATFGLYTVSFSIDSHPLYIYGVDGEYITPQLVDAITVTNGDRFSVLIPLTTPGSFPIRAASVSAPQLMAATATLSYQTLNSTGSAFPPTIPSILDNGLPASPSVRFFSQATQKQFHPPELVQPTSHETFKLYMRISGTSFGWALNSSVLPAAVLDWAADPVVLFSPTPYASNNVTITTLNDTWIDLVFIAATFPMPPHPIHKHGAKMWLIGSGTGPFPWATVDEAVREVPDKFNLVDPPRRDGFVTVSATTEPTWTVMRYHVTNPGAWLLHCHIQGHLSGGMSLVIQDGVDAWPVVPDEYLGYS
ncbi:multicopper oxidase-domain-containing protein [Lasiosphaeria hispida]|uniref:Multicopper oxidase-domain-containing protein n=1 Tax=Lasiosphaeria hispida TaxID=260671 RepID=A0AAJ0HSG2_9PEZI|nr:multicopper oxidase-domain-containing protein [Lasiosphaeria hispida]